MKLTLKTLEKVFFCTGARNHELLNYFSNAALKFEYDERMASFKALGHIKAIKAPVAVCTTSGTAVTECLSALLEAQYSDLPMVLITGDRPKKMHGTGAPQTVDHQSLTQGIAATYIEISVSELAHLELIDPKFPVHINVLVDDTQAHELQIIHQQDISSFSDFYKYLKHPLFLFSHDSLDQRDLITRFFKLGIPFYAESLSGAHELSPIKNERELIKLFKINAFDGIIRIGHTPLSKLWRLLETHPLPVFNFDSRGMPALSYGEVMTLNADQILNNAQWWEIIKNSSYELPKIEQAHSLSSLVAKHPESEVAIFQKLKDALPQNAIVYLGNSLVVRFFELVQDKKFRVFGNRGVNGIDGQLATAIGLAYGVNETVYCVLGDITTMYDLSSLVEIPKNLKLIIINNQGGRIFDMLKLDKRIILEHENNFSAIARAFNLTYAHNLSELNNCQVLELRPKRDQSESFLAEWSI